MKILYVIPRMTYGGGMPNILTEVKAIRQWYPDFTATVVAMENSLSTDMMTDARANGLKVLLSPSESILGKLIGQADLTVVMYWNCPSMFRFFRFLADSQVAHRLCLSVRVNGCTLPQVVPPWAYATCDSLIQVHPRTQTKGLRPESESKIIPSFIRLPEEPAPPVQALRGTFRMFHAGTLNYFKTHPQIIALHEGLQISSYSFDIWGAGMDAAFEADMQQAKNVRYLGFSKNIYADMAPYHLLCNPQTELSYGSFDKIMRESQWMGKPVIVLKKSYIADYVTHGVNGLVAEDEYAYRAAIESLAGDPVSYKRLSESTLEFIRSQPPLAGYVEETIGLYRRTIEKPLKTADASVIPEAPEEAALDGLGSWKETLLQDPAALSAIEINYALRCEGGLIQYYKAYPDNPALRARITDLLAIEQSFAS